MSNVAQKQKRKRIEEAQKHVPRQVIEGGEYDLSWWQTCWDLEWVKAYRF